MNATLYYVHDPMCSWCWGFRPVWDQLKAALSESVTVINVLGGLAADSNLPMSNDMRLAIQGHWKEIQKQLSTEFNFDFWTRSESNIATRTSEIINSQIYTATRAPFETILITKFV